MPSPAAEKARSGMLPISWIAPDDHDSPFPDVERALDEPDGLLAIGGPLSPQRLELAYRSGVFPWFSDEQPVLWWSPDTRAVIRPGRMRIARSLRRRLRRGDYSVTADRAFARVIEACAAPRPGASGTWITPGMIAAYRGLHDRGLAHSLEVWREERLVGGLYGVSVGRSFAGESMFSGADDASKVALAWLNAQLRRWAFPFIDCQMPTDHLISLGATPISRRTFMRELDTALQHPTLSGPWTLDDDLDPLEAASDRS